MSVSVRDTVCDYYEALRRGEPLAPFFSERATVSKVGVFSRHVGYDAVAEELREQNRTTTDWEVESRDLRVVDRETHAWFDDVVALAWEETSSGRRHAYETRWTGTLEPRGDGDADDDDWTFVGMHVSAALDPVGDGDPEVGDGDPEVGDGDDDPEVGDGDTRGVGGDDSDDGDDARGS